MWFEYFMQLKNDFLVTNVVNNYSIGFILKCIWKPIQMEDFFPVTFVLYNSFLYIIWALENEEDLNCTLGMMTLIQIVKSMKMILVSMIPQKAAAQVKATQILINNLFTLTLFSTFLIVNYLKYWGHSMPWNSIYQYQKVQQN